MASKYQRKIKRESTKADTSVENSLLRESAQQVLRHEELTGINRAKWDELLHRRVKNGKTTKEAAKAFIKKLDDIDKRGMAH